MPAASDPSRTATPPVRLAVVGGGFCGTAFAVHLLRDAPGLGVDISIVERRAALGGGLAYDTANPVLRTNVAAARMSLFAEDPAHFDHWLRAGGWPEADPVSLVEGVGLFARRGDVASYMRDLLAEAANASEAGRVRHVHATATAVARAGDGWAVGLDTGGTLAADILVLASGHPAAEPPAALAPLAGDPRLVADPWDSAALSVVRPHGTVLIIGTGLTMADTVATLRDRGHEGPILALSRRGLLPRPRTRKPVAPIEGFEVRPGEPASALLHRVRETVAAAVAAGRPWEDMIDTLRLHGRTIWGGLSPDARRRLLRHVQPFWDSHRYQIAPQVDAILRADLASFRLQVLRGRLTGAGARADGRLAVRYRPAGRGGLEQDIICDAVVACTGPAHRTAMARNPALACLAAGGFIQPDGFGLGIAVDQAGRALDASGAGQTDLLVVGPPARGTWGELMGLPQVSHQPREVAAGLARRLGGG